MPNTQDPTINQKVEELIDKHDLFEGSPSNALYEAILFGQAHMKQELKQIIEKNITSMEDILTDYTNRKDINGLIDYQKTFNPQICILKDLLSALNEI